MSPIHGMLRRWVGRSLEAPTWEGIFLSLGWPRLQGVMLEETDRDVKRNASGHSPWGCPVPSVVKQSSHFYPQNHKNQTVDFLFLPFLLAQSFLLWWWWVTCRKQKAGKNNPHFSYFARTHEIIICDFFSPPTLSPREHPKAKWTS